MIRLGLFGLSGLLGVYFKNWYCLLGCFFSWVLKNWCFFLMFFGCLFVHYLRWFSEIASEIFDFLYRKLHSLGVFNTSLTTIAPILNLYFLWKSKVSVEILGVVDFFIGFIPLGVWGLICLFLESFRCIGSFGCFESLSSKTEATRPHSSDRYPGTCVVKIKSIYESLFLFSCRFCYLICSFRCIGSHSFFSILDLFGLLGVLGL